jgi:hypothetical protein
VWLHTIAYQTLVLFSCLSAHEISSKLSQKCTAAANGIPVMVLATNEIRR